MGDFESALQARIARNAELAEQRRQAEQEMDRVEAAAEERRAREAAEREQAARVRHGELVDTLTAAATALRTASPRHFIVRMGWSASGEEFIAKISSRQLHPARTLFIELDRDDDEVLVRWTSDLGKALELWRLLEVSPPVIEQLVLTIADQDLWRESDRVPPFPEV